MADAFVEMSKQNSLCGSVSLALQKDLEIPLTEDEHFETPPTTPPHSKKDAIGLGIGLEGQKNGLGRRSPQEFENATLNNKEATIFDSEPMKPPPMRRVSREKPSGRSELNDAVPTPPPEIYDIKPRSLSMAHSFDSISVSSSMTSASPAWTSPNTSFCADSLATSFDSTTDETDTTVRPPFGQPRKRYPSGPVLKWPVASSTNDRNTGSRPPLGSALHDPTSVSRKAANIEANAEPSGATTIWYCHAATRDTRCKKAKPIS